MRAPLIITGGLPSIVLTDARRQATVSFSASLGTAAANRFIYAVTWSSGSIPGVTLDGNAMTDVFSPADGSLMRLWSLAYPSGATGTFSITSGLYFAAWAAYGLRSITPYGTNSQKDASASTSTTCNVNTQARGIVLSAALATSASSATWNNLTESSDAVLSGSLWTTAEGQDVAAATPKSNSVTWNTSVTGYMMAASFN